MNFFFMFLNVNAEKKKHLILKKLFFFFNINMNNQSQQFSSLSLIPKTITKKKRKLFFFNFKFYQNLLFHLNTPEQLKKYDEFLHIISSKVGNKYKYQIKKLFKNLYFRKRWFFKTSKKRFWLQRKKQKKLSLFFYKYKKPLFIKKQMYRFKLLQYFFFRYTFTTKKTFKFLKKISKMWFWKSRSRYLNIEFFIKYQLYIFLKQLHFFRLRRQYSIRTNSFQVYYVSFKKLKKLLGQYFLQINNKKIISPFYQIFPYDLIEISYAKFFQQITAYSQFEKTLNFKKKILRQSFFGLIPQNYNFKKRLKIEKYYYLKKYFSKKLFRFFRFLKIGKNYYLRYLGTILKYYKYNKLFFFNFFLLEQSFFLWLKKYVIWNRKVRFFWLFLINKNKKKKKPKKYFLLKYKFEKLINFKRVFDFLKNSYTLYLNFFSFFKRFHTKRLKNIKFIPDKFFKLYGKKKKNLYLFRQFKFSLGKYFKYYKWYEKKLNIRYKQYANQQKKFDDFLERKVSNDERLEAFSKRMLTENFVYSMRKRFRFSFKYYFVSKKYRFFSLNSKKKLLKQKRKILYKKIQWFKRLYFMLYSLKKKQRKKTLMHFQKNFIQSMRILTYIPLVLKKKKKINFRKKRFFLNVKDLRFLYFSLIS
jgi:hypothetical protein